MNSVIPAWSCPRPWHRERTHPRGSFSSCSFSRLWARGHGNCCQWRQWCGKGWGEGDSQRRGKDTWQGRLRSRAAPGPRPRWLAQICPHQPWSKKGYMQSMGRDGAWELRSICQLWLGTARVPVLGDGGQGPVHPGLTLMLGLCTRPLAECVKCCCFR